MGFLGKVLIYPTRHQSPFDHPHPHLLLKRDSRRGWYRDIYWMFMGLDHVGLDWGQGPPQGCLECHGWSLWPWSSAGGGVWGPQPVPHCSPAVASGRGDSALERSFLAPPPYCLYSHLGGQGATPQGLENSKLRHRVSSCIPFLLTRLTHHG